VSWQGATPKFACSASRASDTAPWECYADLVRIGAPSGDLVFAFDSSDDNGTDFHAPDGTRTVSFTRSSATGWSRPQPVYRADCGSAAAGIDGATRYHIVASCGGSIRYSVTRAGGSWSTQTLAHPRDREDRDPQVAFDGAVAYVAYTQVALTEGGCGDDGLRDVGVYYRSRSLPNGAWSVARRLGGAADRLDAFRVDRGTLHATVQAPNGGVFYEMQKGTVFHRYPIANAAGETSLRVGSDGVARIAYVGDGSIRYATFTGAGVAGASIPGSAAAEAPVLVLGKGNQPHLLWMLDSQGKGCATQEPGPLDGTYYATLANGQWSSEKITSRIGPMSLTLDADTGRVHALIGGEGILYYTKDPAGAWTWTALTTPGSFADPVIRLDPLTGHLLVVYVTDAADGARASVNVITKP
jgi:hypothetical protein